MAAEPAPAGTRPVCSGPGTARAGGAAGWRRLLVQALLWTAVGALLLLLASRYLPFSSGLIALYASLSLGLFLSSQVLRALMLGRGWLSLGGFAAAWRVIAMLMVLAALVQALIYVVLTVGLRAGWLDLPGGPLWNPAALTVYWSNTLMFLGVWTGVWLGWHGLFRARRDELARLRAEARARTLEMQSLRARLNPHFVFNALNNLRALISEDRERARELVTRLSNTLRSALYHSAHDQVSLAEELAVVDDYLAVEAVHYESRLRPRVAVDPGALEARLPPMLLQLLVENAIKHGISRTPGGGELGIEATLEQDVLRLRVDNPGRLDGAAQPGGVGLDYLRTRLGQDWPGARFDLRADGPGRVLAELELPQCRS